MGKIVYKRNFVGIFGFFTNGAKNAKTRRRQVYYKITQTVDRDY
jgi:hypothetical protein